VFTRNSIQVRLHQAMLPDQQERDVNLERCALDDRYLSWSRTGKRPTPALAQEFYSLLQRESKDYAVMKTPPPFPPGVLLALTSWSAIEAVDWLLVYYPAFAQEDGQERTVAWEFSAVDQEWHPQELESLESALRLFGHLVQMQAAEVRRTWDRKASDG
jgi:hypothetical protein